MSPAPRGLGFRAEPPPQTRQNCARCGLTISPRTAWLTVDYCPRCLARDRIAIRLGDPDRAPVDHGCDAAHRLAVRDSSIEG